MSNADRSVGLERSQIVWDTVMQSKHFKMVLDISLLNTQHYKVRIKDKVEQSKEKSSTLPYTSV